MPIPSYEFEDESSGSPRQPISVRFACLAANWTPRLLAVLITGDENLGSPLLRVLEYDENTGHAGEVHPESYSGLIPPEAALPEAVAALPRTHFLWSDELVTAFSDFIDLTSDREMAREMGLGIRWRPALRGVDALISECPDLSSLTSTASGDCTLKRVHNAWLASFDGIEVPLKHSIGLHYLYYLLQRPSREVTATVLSNYGHFPGDWQAAEDDGQSRDDRSEEAEDDGHSSDARSEDVEVIEEGAIEKPGPDISGRANLGDSERMLDYVSIKYIKAGIEKLKERIAQAKAKGKMEVAKDLQAELLMSERILRTSRNKDGLGRPMGSNAERARKATLKAIKKAIADIEQQHHAFGAYLRTTIETGHKCSYRPELAE